VIAVFGADVDHHLAGLNDAFHQRDESRAPTRVSSALKATLGSKHESYGSICQLVPVGLDHIGDESAPQEASDPAVKPAFRRALPLVSRLPNR